MSEHVAIEAAGYRIKSTRLGMVAKYELEAT